MEVQLSTRPYETSSLGGVDVTGFRLHREPVTPWF